MYKRCFVFFLFICSTVFAQEALKSIEEEYYDFLSLQGIVERPTLGYRTLSDSKWEFIDKEELIQNQDGTFSKVTISDKESAQNIWKNNNLGSTWTLWQKSNAPQNWFTRGINQDLKLKIYGPEWFNSFNTAAPYGQNDGALWQGRGYNTSLTAGVRLEAFGFEATIKPQICFMQNLEFEYLTGVNGSDYSYFVGGIDYVQRYGDSPFWTYDWGDTEIRWSWHNFTVGFGTQNPWLGLSYLNPMLGSNNAASYPKFDIGLRKTRIVLPGLKWYIGDIEARTWIGMMKESNYITDLNNPSKINMLHGINASFSPSVIPGFTIGFSRILINRWTSEHILDQFRLFTLDQKNNIGSSNKDAEDQKFSLYADWLFTKVGFEIYGELGIDDFTSDNVANPFHTGIYTIGVKQKIPLPLEKLNSSIPQNLIQSELILEWNNFEMSQDFQLQWPYGGYYFHGAVLQGYTNKGQILGAGSGQMGNSQFIAYKVYYPKGNITLFFQRECPDNNYIYNMAVRADASYPSSTWEKYYAKYETNSNFGLSWLQFWTPCFYTQLGFVVQYTHNLMYDGNKNRANVHVEFSCKYNF